MADTLGPQIGPNSSKNVQKSTFNFFTIFGAKIETFEAV